MCGKHAVMVHANDYDRQSILRYSEHKVAPRKVHYKICPKCKPEINLTVKLYQGGNAKFKLPCNLCRNCHTIFAFDDRISFEPFTGVKN